jgi:hypothetical protein
LLHFSYFSKLALVVFSPSIFVPVVGAIYLVLCSLNTCLFLFLEHSWQFILHYYHSLHYFQIPFECLLPWFAYYYDHRAWSIAPFFFFSRVSSTESYCFSKLTYFPVLTLCSNRWYEMERFGGKWSRSVWGIIPELPWRKCGKWRKTFVRTVGVPADMWTKHICKAGPGH